MILRNVSIGYRIPVVTAINAELHAGEFVCLVGRNGSGKTTLLKTIAGLVKPLAGEIIHSQPAISSALVLTEFPPLQNTSVFEFVAYGRLPYLNLFSKLREEDLAAVENAIETVGIKSLRDRKTSCLSDGERQKTMIARALAQGSDILLLDEPSAFLDYESKQELMHLLLSLAHDSGKSLILSTHDLDLVRTYADSVWKISENRLTFCPIFSER